MADTGNFGQKFVVDILTRYRDEGMKQAQEAQAKLNTILTSTQNVFSNTQKAAIGYDQGLTGVIGKLTQLNKLTPMNIASMFNLERLFLNIAAGAARAITNVAAFGEELYYMNRRLGQPGTAGLFNFAFAGSQIGLSAAQSLGAVESMGAAVRTNPGLAGLLSRFLPGYRGGAVGSAETLGLVNQFKGRFGENGYFIASQFAEQLGIGEHEFRQMWVNIDELNEQYRVHNERLKEFGLNTDKSSKSFVEFNRALNTVIDILDIQATKIGSWLAENIGTPVLKGAATAMQSGYASRALQWLNFAGGTGPFPGWGGGTESQSVSPGGLDRSRFAQELAVNPALRNKIMAISAGENLNPIANQAVLESMMNRASMMGTTLGFEARTTGEGGYYAGYNPSALQNARTLEMITDNLNKVLGGSNVSRGATDNASGAFAASRVGLYAPTFSAGGETFFYPNNVGARGADKYQAWYAQNFGSSSPSGGNVQNFDVDHNVTVNIQGNADSGIWHDAASLLNRDRWDEQLRQAVRGANFR